MGSNSDPLTAKPSGRVGTGPRLHERQRVRVVGRPTPRAVAVLQQHMASVERHMGPWDKQFESRLENLPPPPCPVAPRGRDSRAVPYSISGDAVCSSWA